QPPATHIHTLSLHDALPILNEYDIDALENAHEVAQAAADRAGAERREQIDRAGAESLLPGNNRVDVPKDILDQNRRHQAELANLDRKSTRLNSSHQIISYAV